MVGWWSVIRVHVISCNSRRWIERCSGRLRDKFLLQLRIGKSWECCVLSETLGRKSVVELEESIDKKHYKSPLNFKASCKVQHLPASKHMNIGRRYFGALLRLGIFLAVRHYPHYFSPGLYSVVISMRNSWSNLFCYRT